MSWNYRLCKSTYKGDGYEEVSYVIHEVYYNKDGSIWAVTENGASVYGESVGEAKEVMDKMLRAFEKDVIDLDTIVFAERTSDEEVTKLV